MHYYAVPFDISTLPHNPKIFLKKSGQAGDDGIFGFGACFVFAEKGHGRQDFVNIRSVGIEHAVLKSVMHEFNCLFFLKFFFLNNPFQFLFFFPAHEVSPSPCDISVRIDGTDKLVNQFFFASQLRA